MIKKIFNKIKELTILRVDYEPEIQATKIEDKPKANSNKQIEVRIAERKREKEESKYRLTKMAREELATRIRAMGPEELKIVADNIPIELCYNRIGEELKKYEETKRAVKESVKMMS